MWQEARKQERKIRGMMVDYKKRAERRRDFYDKIRRDPAQFLQIHGRPLKVHIDASVSQAAENCLMPWCGDKNSMIDRFDGRAHLDSLPVDSKEPEVEVTKEDRDANYERWKTLVQSEFLGIPETKVLHQIYLEERCGTLANKDYSVAQQNVALKKKLSEKKAAIGYKYEDSEETIVQPKKDGEQSSSGSSSEDETDYDTTINVNNLSAEQGIKLQTLSHKYGMRSDDFVRQLDEDRAESERIRMAKEVENEKSMYAGRKSRRERKALKDRRLLIMRANVSKDPESQENDEKECSSSSESEKSVDPTKVEFITSFGQSSEEEEVKPELKTIAVKNTKLRNLKKTLEKEDKEMSPGNIVFGPSLPEEHKVSSDYRFKSSGRVGRSYRHERDTSRDRKRRSRSRSRDRYSRYRRSRSRSKDRTRRSRSRDRTRRSRSRDRRSSRSKDRKRSREHTRNRRSSSREYRRRRHSSRSRDRSPYKVKNSKSERKEREVQRSPNVKITSPCSTIKETTSIHVDKLDEAAQKGKNDVKLTEPPKISNSTMDPVTSDPSCHVQDIALPSPAVEETLNVPSPIALKPPSPPRRSYYRHDLVEEKSSSEEEQYGR